MWNKKNRKRLEMAQGIKATSKSSLKLQCLFASKGDIKEAKELYEFFAEDLATLPDFDPVKPNWMDNTKNAVNGFFAWFKENQETLAQGYDFVRSVIEKRGLPSAPSAGTPLPPINE